MPPSELDVKLGLPGDSPSPQKRNHVFTMFSLLVQCLVLWLNRLIGITARLLIHTLEYVVRLSAGIRHRPPAYRVVVVYVCVLCK
jgi:hypothetical protein